MSIKDKYIKRRHPKWFNQLNLLLWKNFKLQFRSVLSTILGVSVPILFAIILLPIRTIVKTDNYLNNTIYPTFEINDFPFQPKLVSPNVKWILGFQPNSSKINEIMDMVSSKLNLEVKRKLVLYPHKFINYLVSINFYLFFKKTIHYNLNT